MPPVTVPQAFALAAQHHQAGRLAEAETIYRQILAVQPDHADSLQMLGVIAHQAGRHDLALEWLHRAIARDPNNATAHSNLGAAYQALDRLDEAIASERRALQLNPASPESHHILGIALARKRQFEEAITCFRRTIQLKPDYPTAHFNLGLALAESGRLDDAIAAYRQALALHADFAAAHINLGVVLAEKGHLEDAIASYRRALEINPDHAKAHNNLGNALKDQGRFGDAIAVYRRAIELNPNFLEAHYNLGNALRALARLDEAVVAYRCALQLKPDDATTYGNLGTALAEQGQLDEAIAAYRHGLKLKPDFPWLHSNLAHTLHFHPDHDDRMIAEAQDCWNRQFSEPSKQFVVPHANGRSPERRLRVGYVSPDFREHVVGRNLLPLFRCCDRQSVEMLCYSGVVQPDKMTAKFQEYAQQWRSTLGVSDEAVAEMIRQDGVDILVDLSQHLAGNRLPVFARRPAPVQVSFAGYPDGTGLEAIEYRISDRWLESCATEMGDRSSEIEVAARTDLRSPISILRAAERVYLLDSFWCYDPCGIEAAINELPAKVNGFVTFGCLNSFSKVNERVLQLWARVLNGVKSSRLVVRSGSGSHRQRAFEVLEREGIERSRVEFVEPRPHGDYLESHHRLDMMLDPFPYGGHTTSLDALWMGVPVVSLAGKTSVSRAGLSILSNLGLPELVAFSEDNYVTIATELAADLPRLTELRATLRSRMESSVLMDAPRFTRQIEITYRAMWRRWCAS